MAAVGIVVGTASAVAAPAADADITASAAPLTETTQAIRAVTDSTAVDAQRRIPSRFDATYYAPTIEDGVLVNPSGDCSSPVPLPSEFDTACKAHDLGYDLIRFGDASGLPSAPQSRKELDRRFGEATEEACRPRTGIGSRTVCYVMSGIASGSVQFNSWRQHYGPPESEPALPFLLVGIFGSAIASAGLLARAISTPRRPSAAIA